MFDALTGLALAVALNGAGGLAEGQSIDSAYTRDLTCGETEEGTEYGPYFTPCVGYAGWAVSFASSEHSTRVAYGDRGLSAQLDQSPRLGGLDGYPGDVIEWRVRDDGAGWTPFATILRWSGSTPNFDPDTGGYAGGATIVGQVLVVAALRETGPISACHVAYVDALEVADHNVIARLVADNLAPTHDCAADGVLLVDEAEAARLRRLYGG